MITYIEDQLTVEIYSDLRKQVDWKGLSQTQAKKAIDGSLKIIVAYEDDKPVGMGRIVGDGAVISYVQDLIVVPDAQGKGVGGEIMRRLTKYAESITEPGTQMMFCLMSAKGRESFYEQYHFTARPTDTLGPGMIQYIIKED